jgi:hypothetical protein
MVFGLDDLADASVLGVIWVIFSSLFPEVSEGVASFAAGIEPEITSAFAPIAVETSTISVDTIEGSSIVLIQDLLGDDGLEAAVDIATGDMKNYENLPIGQKELDIAENVINSIGITETEATYPGLKQTVGKLVESVGKNINPDNKGFLQLLGDIVKPLLQNPVETIAGVSGVVGTVSAAGTTSYQVINKIKNAFDKDENLPEEIQNNIIAKSNNDNTQSAYDQVLGNLPMTIMN